MSRHHRWWSDERVLGLLTDLFFWLGCVVGVGLGLLYTLGVLQLSSTWTTLQYISFGLPFGVMFARRVYVSAHRQWHEARHEYSFEEWDELFLGSLWVVLLSFAAAPLLLGLYLYLELRFERSGGPPSGMSPRRLRPAIWSVMATIRFWGPNWHEIDLEPAVRRT